jgi:hypothetical protein
MTSSSSSMQNTWSLLRNATAAVGSLKAPDPGGGAGWGPAGHATQGGPARSPSFGTQQRQQVLLMLAGGGSGSQQDDDCGGGSPPGGVLGRSGSTQQQPHQGLQRAGSLLRQHSFSRPGLLATSSDPAAWDPPSPRSTAGGSQAAGAAASQPGLAVDSSYNALKQSLSRLEQQNRQLSQRSGELEAALEERGREWQQVGWQQPSETLAGGAGSH